MDRSLCEKLITRSRRIKVTEEQLKKAAYKLCELRNQDPEEYVNEPSNPNDDGECLGSLCTVARWFLAQNEIKQFDLIQQAILFGKE